MAGNRGQALFWLEWDTTALDAPFFVIPSVAEGSAVRPDSRPKVSVPLVVPQTRHPERSASQIDRVTQHLWRGVEGPRLRLSYPCCSELFDTEARQQDLLRFAQDVDRYIFSCTVIIFHPQVCARSLNSGLIMSMRLSFFARRQPLSNSGAAW